MYVVLGYYNSSSLLVLNILYKGKRKWIYISAFIVVPHTQGAQVRIHRVLPTNYTVPRSTW